MICCEVMSVDAAALPCLNNTVMRSYYEIHCSADSQTYKNKTGVIKQLKLAKNLTLMPKDFF